MLNEPAFSLNLSSISPSSTSRHAMLLHGLIRWLKPDRVLEIGAWQGYSTIWMARALQENGNGHLFTIDNFTLCGITEEKLRRNLAVCGVSDEVTILSGDSLNVNWPDDLDFAFIDGNHSYKYVCQEVEKACAVGATCICLHDTTAWWGPRAYVEMFRLQPNKEWDIIEADFDEGLTVFMRRPDLKLPISYPERTHPSGHL